MSINPLFIIAMRNKAMRSLELSHMITVNETEKAIVYRVYEPTNDPVYINENTIDISHDIHNEFITNSAGQKLGNILTRRGADKGAAVALGYTLITNALPETKDKLKIGSFCFYIEK